MKERVYAVFLFLISVLALMKTWYFVPSLDDFMPGAFEVALFWIGYWFMVVCLVAIKPIHIILSENIGDPLSPIKGVSVFVVSIFLIPFINMLMTSFTNMWSGLSSYSDIFGVGYVILGLFGFIMVPSYFIIGDVVTERLS